MLVTAVGGMSGVIGILWKQVQGHFDDIEAKLNLAEKRYLDCEEDRLRIWKSIAEQTGKDVKELKGENK